MIFGFALVALAAVAYHVPISRSAPQRYEIYFVEVNICFLKQTDTMAPNLSEDEIDDLIYFARTGDTEDLNTSKAAICKRENVSVLELLEVVKDEKSGNGVMHMAAANGHHSKSHFGR